jgi:hypothetical protein
MTNSKFEEQAALHGNLDLMNYWSNIGARSERQKIIGLLASLKLELINEAKKLSGTKYEDSAKKTALLALGVEESIIRIRRENDK